MFYEFARWDVSIATFMIVHNSLGLSVIDRCGGTGAQYQHEQHAVNLQWFEKLPYG